MIYLIKETYKMGQEKELNIKNQTYYFFNDIINIKNFGSKLLKIDKKHYKDIDIYYIRYITIKKIKNCGNIHSLNPLYLIFYWATGYFIEENNEKYLILDSTEKFFSGIRSKIKTINERKELIYDKNYARIRVDTDDDIPMNKQIKCPMLTIIIRCIFQEGEKLYPQIYLDEYLYEF